MTAWNNKYPMRPLQASLSPGHLPKLKMKRSRVRIFVVPMVTLFSLYPFCRYESREWTQKMETEMEAKHH